MTDDDTLIPHQMAHKIAVVTGSSKGIGKAIVIAFAKSNKYSGIVTNARKIEEAQTVSDEINRMDCESVALGDDVSKEGNGVMLMKKLSNIFRRWWWYGVVS